MKRIKRFIKDLFIKQLNQKDLLNYWKNPTINNRPERYFTQTDRSQYLVKLIDMIDKEFFTSDSYLKILEIGCSVGRNLFYIEGSRSCKLSGIEINVNAIIKGKVEYSNLQEVKFYLGDIATEIRTIPQQDIIFSMAVLQHIHKSKIRKLCKDISDKTDIVILIENETYKSERHNKNNYKKIFKRLKYKEIYYNFCMSKYGFIQKGFVTRILKKR